MRVFVYVCTCKIMYMYRSVGVCVGVSVYPIVYSIRFWYCGAEQNR